MATRPIRPRARAHQDITDAIDYLRAEGGPAIALAFIDELEHAFRHIAAHPASGSTRYAIELNLPDLRFWPLRSHPYLVFYVEAASHIDIWRVLHGRRDIPESLRLNQT